MSFRVPHRLALLLALAAGACGSGSADQGGTGTVTDQWRKYCVATFTQDYEVSEYQESLFTARAGEEYLISDASGSSATLIYLTPKGPYDFKVEPAEGAQTMPFKSSCSDKSKSYYAVFSDVTVYDSKDLSKKLCDLPAGTVVPRDQSQMTGYMSADMDFNLSGPTTYEVTLNAFSASCGNAEKGYVSVPSTKVFGTTTWLVPFDSIEGP